MFTHDTPPDQPKVTSFSTLAEVHRHVLADEALPERQRRDLASALKSLAKALGATLDTMPPDPRALRPKMAGLTPAMVRLSTGRWRNVLSLTSAALAHVGILCVQGRIKTEPSPAWGAILDRLPLNGKDGFHLRRFGRYCTDRGIEPSDITDAVIATYLGDLTDHSLVAEPERSAREVARSWSNAVGAIAGWPQRSLTVPDNRRQFAPSPDTYPDRLRADVDAWLAALGDDDLFNEDRPRPLNATSIATRRRQIRAYLGALAQPGTSLTEVPDLASAVAPQRFRQAMTFFWQRAGNTKTHHLHQMAGLALMIARHWAKLPAEDLKTLETLAAKLRMGNHGITVRNVERLRQFDRPGVQQAFIDLPVTLAREAMDAKVISVFTALIMQTAVTMDILLHVPLRLRNLLNLRIGTHLNQDRDGSFVLDIPGAEVKNHVGVNVVLNPSVSQMLSLYIDHFRPLLCPGPNDWLFPGQTVSKPKSDVALRTQLTRSIAKRVGIEVHPHIFRHFSALVILYQPALTLTHCPFACAD